MQHTRRAEEEPGCSVWPEKWRTTDRRNIAEGYEEFHDKFFALREQTAHFVDEVEHVIYRELNKAGVSPPPKKEAAKVDGADNASPQSEAHDENKAEVSPEARTPLYEEEEPAAEEDKAEGSDASHEDVGSENGEGKSNPISKVSIIAIFDID